MPDLKLAALLDAARPDRLRPSLDAFFAPGTEIKVAGTRLQPPSCFWAVYRSGERRVVLKSFFAAEDAERYVARLATAYPERVGRPGHPEGGVLPVPELNGVLWAYPFDPSMPGLGRCLDGAWIADAIGREAAVRPELRSYEPEVGAVFAYRAPGRRRAGRVVAYGKVSADDASGLTFVVMNRLWQALGGRSAPVRLAKPLAFRPEAGLLLQAAVRGRPVGPDRNRRVFLDLVRAASAGLAAIHGADVPFGRPRRLDDLLARLRRGLDDLALVAPPLHLTLRRLLDQIEARAARVPADPLVPSHGDYKWDQLLEYRGRFALIDFELYCRAEPALDVGYFCAYLVPSQPADWREGSAAELLRARFLHGYLAASPTPPALARIGLYEAAVLAIRALAHTWQHQPGWQLSASQLLDLAFERLVSPEPAALDAGEPTATGT